MPKQFESLSHLCETVALGDNGGDAKAEVEEKDCSNCDNTVSLAISDKLYRQLTHFSNCASATESETESESESESETERET